MVTRGCGRRGRLDLASTEIGRHHGVHRWVTGGAASTRHALCWWSLGAWVGLIGDVGWGLVVGPDLVR